MNGGCCILEVNRQMWPGSTNKHQTRETRTWSANLMANITGQGLQQTTLVRKSGQEVVPPFWAQKIHVLKVVKAPIFKRFPGKIGGSQLFWKGYVRKRPKTKTRNSLGVFKFDAILSRHFVFCKKAGFGGGGGNERNRVMSEMVVVFVFVAVVGLLLLLFLIF